MRREREFAGSGGAIVGTYEGDATLDALRAALGAIGCRVVTPEVFEQEVRTSGDSFVTAPPDA